MTPSYSTGMKGVLVSFASAPGAAVFSKGVFWSSESAAPGLKSSCLV